MPKGSIRIEKKPRTWRIKIKISMLGRALALRLLTDTQRSRTAKTRNALEGKTLKVSQVLLRGI